MRFSRLFATYKNLAKHIIQKKGKCQTAFKQVFSISANFKLKHKFSPLRILRKATGYVQPLLYIRSFKRGRRVNEFPVFFIDKRDGLKKGLQMLFNDFDKKANANFITRSTNEIFDAYRKRGFVFQRVVAHHKLCSSLKFNRFGKKKRKFKTKIKTKNVR